MNNIQEEFIKDCIRKDRKAQAMLHKYCFHLLMPICYKYMKQEELSREMYNQIFVKIIFSLSKFDHNKDFNKWAKTIAINFLIDEYRKKERMKKVMDENVELESIKILNVANSQISPVEINEENEKVEALLLKLPPTTRNVFKLFALEGFSHQEIGEQLNMSIGTSKWHVSNAKASLKKIVANFFQIIFILK